MSKYPIRFGAIALAFSLIGAGCGSSSTVVKTPTAVVPTAPVRAVPNSAPTVPANVTVTSTLKTVDARFKDQGVNVHVSVPSGWRTPADTLGIADGTMFGYGIEPVNAPPRNMESEGPNMPISVDVWPKPSSTSTLEDVFRDVVTPDDKTAGRVTIDGISFYTFNDDAYVKSRAYATEKGGFFIKIEENDIYPFTSPRVAIVKGITFTKAK
jgi:hypothetical protein